MMDNIGNSRADALAVDASLNRDLPPDIVQEVEETRKRVEEIHREIVAILCEWQEAVQELAFLYDSSIPHPPL